MTSPTPNEEDLFHRALALPASERAAFLDRTCAGQPTLRAGVEALLKLHTQSDSFLREPAPEAAATIALHASPVEEKAGDTIGRYKLLQLIGEGGCGMVYMAEQEVPVRRRVALKVIKLGMDTKAVIARFEAERQALALMDHPHIAKVLDAGATDAGRPFFVMELVRGLPITKYCDENNVPTATRLQLFSQVCHAIQHAHQKGVIHRDVKPSNILVTLHDGEAVPKVIDFGIAKATQGRLTDQTLFTAFEQFIGTPAYMSPEQAEMSGLDIDTRSDIYSLGVLLYELLTGRPPFDPKTFLAAGLDEMRRIIREVEPPRPSTRLSTLTDADRSTVARLRGAGPQQLTTQLSGDLDWIVMKALEKNRTRRYESASAFAADIQRHLRNEPVVARPPSTAYLLQKLVRRHRVAFAAGSAIAAALVLGFGFSTWSFINEKAARQEAVAAGQEQLRQRQQAELARERAVAAEAEQSKAREQAEAARNEEARQRALAEEARNAETRQRALAEEARNNEGRQRAAAEEARASEAKQRLAAEANEKKAKSAAARSDQAFKFMAGMLQGVGPSVAAGRDTTLLREILDKTIKRLDVTLKDQPEVEANLRSMLGSVYLDLGETAKAEAMTTDALAKVQKLHGREHEDVATALHALGMVRVIQGKCPEAETFFREALDILKKLPGDQDDSLKGVFFMLGVVQFKQGMLIEAEASLRQALTIARKETDVENSRVDNILMLIGNVLVAQGRLAEAEPLIRDALAALRQSRGHEPVSIGSSLIALSNVLRSQGKLAEAATTFAEGLALLKKIYGPEHPTVVQLLFNQALIALQQGKLADAEILLRDTLVTQKKVLGSEHDTVANTLQLLAGVLEQQSKPAEVEALRREITAIRSKVLGSPEMAEAGAKMSRANSALQQGKWAEAEAGIREAVATAEKKVGPANPEIIQARMKLADAVFQQGPSRSAEAETILREALASSRQAFGNNSTYVADALLFLARACEVQGKLADTEASLREMLAISKSFTTDGENANVADAMLLLAAIRARLGDTVEASTFVKAAAPISRKLPANQQERGLASANAMANALRQKGKTDEADAVERVMLDFVSQRDGTNSRAYEQVIIHLASSLNGTGKFAEAEPLARQGWELRKKLRPATDWTVANAHSVYGESLLGGKKYAEAEAVLLPAFAQMQTNRPQVTGAALRSYLARLRTVAGALVQIYEETKQPTKVGEWKAKVAELTGVTATGLAAPAATPGESDLAALVAQETQLRRQRDFAGAVAVQRQIIELVSKRDDRQSATTAAQLARLAQTFVQDEKFAEAEPFARESLTLREQLLRTGNWQVADSRRILGTSLLGQKKFAEAEPVLLQTYADLQQVEASIPAANKRRIPETAALLALLYENTGQPEKAGAWKLKAAAAPQP